MVLLYTERLRDGREPTSYYGVYSDIFSSIPTNCVIRKPIENKELMERINEIIK